MLKKQGWKGAVEVTHGPTLCQRRDHSLSKPARQTHPLKTLVKTTIIPDDTEKEGSCLYPLLPRPWSNLTAHETVLGFPFPEGQGILMGLKCTRFLLPMVPTSSLFTKCFKKGARLGPEKAQQLNPFSSP